MMDRDTLLALLKKTAPTAHEVTLTALADLYMKDPEAVKQIAKSAIKSDRKSKNKDTPKISIGPATYEGITVKFD